MFLTRFGLQFGSKEIVDDAVLVLSEVMSNALRHARPVGSGKVKVAWDVRAGAVEIEVTDGGGATLRFESGYLELLSDGTYYLEVEAEFNGGGVVMVDEGTYDMAGNAIDFTPAGEPSRMRDGVVNGSSIKAEVQFGGIPFEIDLRK